MSTAAVQRTSKQRTSTQPARSVSESRPPAKLVRRIRTSDPAVVKASLKASITSLRHSDQLRLLTEITDTEIPSVVGKNIGRMKKHIGGDIKLVAKAQARKGSSLQSQQLLDIALRAVAADPRLDAARQTTFSSLRRQPAEIQRGQLHALSLFGGIRIAQELPDIAADALSSLLAGSPPRSRCAKELVDSFDGRLDDFEAKYEHREDTLIKRFADLGVERILKPALEADYPTDKKRQSDELEKILKGDDLLDLILRCCEGWRRFEGQGEKIDPKVLAVVDELERINAMLDQCNADAVNTAAMTMAKELTRLLSGRLPAAQQAELTRLLHAPDSEVRAVKIKALLQTPLTSPAQLVDNLKTEAEILEGLQIVWGGAPVYSLRFARDLSEMLRLSDDPSRLLLEVESTLVTRIKVDRLGNYPMQRLRELRKTKPNDSPRSQLVIDSVTRVMTPPSDDKPDQQLKIWARRRKALRRASVPPEELAAKRHTMMASANFAVKPGARPHSDMLDWLETKKSDALKLEAASRPANPMPKPRLDRRNARARLFVGPKLKPKAVAPAPQLVAVQAVPAQVVPAQVVPAQAIPAQAIPAPQAAPTGKRKLKRRFVRETTVRA